MKHFICPSCGKAWDEEFREHNSTLTRLDRIMCLCVSCERIPADLREHVMRVRVKIMECRPLGKRDEKLLPKLRRYL